MTVAYDTIRGAMNNRQQVFCSYQGHRREVCLHALGWGKQGEEKTIGFQFGGGSSQGLPPGGDWKCMDIAQMLDISVQDGSWHTRDQYSRQQTCVKTVDFEILG